jgi:hypothetical protein
MPYFNCDWNYDLFLSHNLITHLALYRADIVREIGGFRDGLRRGAQDYDLALRFIERIDPRRFVTSRVLYHWRMLPGSTSVGAGEKDYAASARGAAVEELPRGRASRRRVETMSENGRAASQLSPAGATRRWFPIIHSRPRERPRSSCAVCREHPQEDNVRARTKSSSSITAATTTRRRLSTSTPGAKAR